MKTIVLIYYQEMIVGVIGGNMIGLQLIMDLSKMNQREVADILGIKKQNIDAWINGKRKIPAKHLPKLAEIFKIPKEFFQKELTKIDKIELQNMIDADNAIEYEDTVINSNGEITKIKKVLDNGIDIDRLRIEEFEKEIILTNVEMKQVIDKKVWEGPNFTVYDKLNEGKYVLNLYRKLTKAIVKGAVRLDVINDMLDGILDYKDEFEGKKPKRSSYTKKVTKNIDKEQIKREEEDRIRFEQENEELINEELKRYEEEQRVKSPEEKERREMMDKLFK